MPAGDEPVDDADAALGRDHQVRPAAAGVDDARLVGHGLERAHDGGADGDHAARPLVDAARGVRGDLVVLGVRALAAFLRGDAGVERDALDADAAVAQRLQRGLRERARGARHLGAARFGGEDRLVVAERARRGVVGVPDRCAVAVQVGEQRLRELELRDPQPAGAEIRREQRGATARGQRERLRARLHAATVAAHLDDVAVPVGRGEVEIDGGAVCPARGQRRRNRRRRIGDQQVARAQVGGEGIEVGVDEAVAVATP